jgi:isoleucyl-tRNA synthetase
VAEDALRELLATVDMAEICITSGLALMQGEGPPDAFRDADVPGVAVVPRPAQGRKCARSWKFSTQIGADPDYPDVTPRDAQALRERDAADAAA